MNKKPTYEELYQMYTEAHEDALFYKLVLCQEKVQVKNDFFQ